jgi:hypothetical protein
VGRFAATPSKQRPQFAAFEVGPRDPVALTSTPML